MLSVQAGVAPWLTLFQLPGGVVDPSVSGCFCVVVPGFTGLTKLSHESPARQHWAALAASESRGTPLGQANNQPTNSSSGSCQATRSKAVRNRGGRRRAIAQRLFDSDRPRDKRQSSTGSPVQRHVSLSCTSGAAGIRSRRESKWCSSSSSTTWLIPLISLHLQPDLLLLPQGQ